jgi:hypothetical protein
MEGFDIYSAAHILVRDGRTEHAIGEKPLPGGDFAQPLEERS